MYSDFLDKVFCGIKGPSIKPLGFLFRIPREEEVFLEIAQGSLYPIAASVLAKFEQFYESVFEIFGDEVLELISTVKNILLR